MRQNVVDKPVRNMAYQLVGCQALLVLIVALIFAFSSGLMAMSSALLGGAAMVIPSFVFAWRLFRQMSARAAKQIIQRLYAGELLKLIASAILAIFLIRWVPVELLPFFCGFIAGALGFWLAPLLMRNALGM